MNQVIETILNRKSIRAYEQRAVPEEVREQLLAATMRAPTAGNMMLYSIIEVTNQAMKERLVETCDHQDFIATAPLVLVFLADYQRWFDYFLYAGVESLLAGPEELVRPKEGDLMLACCDALIAAQTAVLAAESFGLGSCYIGDILENFEIHQELFDLPPYAVPVAMLCIGYPTPEAQARKMTRRFGPEFVVFENQYQRLEGADFERMYRPITENIEGTTISGPDSIAFSMYQRKFSARFSIEMRRSVRAMLQSWAGRSLT